MDGTMSAPRKDSNECCFGGSQFVLGRRGSRATSQLLDTHAADNHEADEEQRRQQSDGLRIAHAEAENEVEWIHHEGEDATQTCNIVSITGRTCNLVASIPKQQGIRPMTAQTDHPDKRTQGKMQPKVRQK